MENYAKSTHLWLFSQLHSATMVTTGQLHRATLLVYPIDPFHLSSGDPCVLVRDHRDTLHQNLVQEKRRNHGYG